MDNQQELQAPPSEGGRSSRLFLYLFGIPLIVAVVLVTIATNLGW